MKYENEIISIEYNECDKDYIYQVIDELNNNYKNILGFFNINALDKKIYFKFYDSILDFKEFISNNGWVYLDWITANTNSNHKKSRIDALSLKERINAKGHSNDTKDSIIKMVIHEFVHVCHFQFNDYNESLKYVLEGLATNLCNQYSEIKGTELDCSIEDLIEQNNINYYNYFLIFNYIINNYPHEYVLKMANSKKFAIQETPRLYIEVNEWLYNLNSEKNKLI